MKKIIHLLVALIVGLGFNSCTKDSDVFIVDPGQITGPDSTWYANITSTMPAAKMQNLITFAAETDSLAMDNAIHTITFPSGLTCTFPANAFVTNTGATVDGKVAIEAYLLKKKGDLIKMSRSTVSDNRMLVSGGTIFIEGKKDGSLLKLATDKKIKIQFDNSITSSKMNLFDGDNTNPLMFNWKQCADTLNSYNKVLQTASGYEFYTNRLQWMNCNYFYNIGAGDSVKVALKLPPTFTNANTLTYLVFNDFTSVLPLSGSAIAKNFISTALPNGKSVTVITITKEGNFFYLGHNGFVTSKSSADYQNVNINPARVTLDELKNYLDNL